MRSESALARELAKVGEKDRRQIEQAQELLGAEPRAMGFIKSLFWGRFRSDLVLPYPEVASDEVERCGRLLDALDRYLRDEHPAVAIDQEQRIPDRVVARLFELGVMGMIIPREHGGGGFSITSYNRVLERIGRTCGSTAVLVSAHQSIGCGAVTLFGSEEQKRRWLPRMARDTLSAFCLSEPNVGCDAAGQETRCEPSADGRYYLLNGEKKWATSAALAGMFTVMARQRVGDPEGGQSREKVTALIVTPDMDGVEIFSRNRSKCGIRGTWQARIRLRDVRVPRENRLGEEGRGLNIALGCLNYGRCTLSAGMVGSGRAAYEQATKWARYRYQFERPIGEFEQVREKIAAMAAHLYAMEAMLYMTTGMVDRSDEDLMLETAACKVFCSELGYRSADHAMQVMGGEGYVTENELERVWRDSRIHRIVEGANEVMHSFLFGYGSKQLGERLLALRSRPWRSPLAAVRVAAELFLGLKRRPPATGGLHPSLGPLASRLAGLVRDFGHQVKKMLQVHRERLVAAQMIHARLSWSAIWLYAMTCTLARFDRTLARGASPEALAYERAMVEHVLALGSEEVQANLRGLRRNTDATMRRAADAAWRWIDRLPDGDYYLPERTPVESARGRGKLPSQEAIPQFGAGSGVKAPSP